jgi:hypothetical protein
MSDFEFVFSLFGLMLGFSLAELVGGLVRALKARRHMRLGWLTPALGLFVMLDLTSFWSTAWDNRAAIPASYGILVLGLLATGLYFFAASLVFPETIEASPDLDEHFYQRRRAVLGGVAFCNLLAIAALALIHSPQVTQPTTWAVHIFYFTMILLAALPRRRWLNLAALGLLILLYLFFVVVTLALAPAPAMG